MNTLSLDKILQNLTPAEKANALKHLESLIPGRQNQLTILGMIDGIETPEDLQDVLNKIGEYSHQIETAAINEIKTLLSKFVNNVNKISVFDITQRQQNFTKETTIGELRDSIKNSSEAANLVKANPMIGLGKIGVTNDTTLEYLGDFIIK